MQTNNRFFEDLARVANGALSAAAGIREELEQVIRQQFERFLSDHDLVTREEFEAAREMAAKARAEQETLSERVASLEARLAALESVRKPKPAPAKRRKVREDETSTSRRRPASKTATQTSGSET